MAVTLTEVSGPTRVRQSTGGTPFIDKAETLMPAGVIPRAMTADDAVLSAIAEPEAATPTQVAVEEIAQFIPRSSILSL